MKTKLLRHNWTPSCYQKQPIFTYRSANASKHWLVVPTAIKKWSTHITDSDNHRSMNAVYHYGCNKRSVFETCKWVVNSNMSENIYRLHGDFDKDTCSWLVKLNNLKARAVKYFPWSNSNDQNRNSVWYYEKATLLEKRKEGYYILYTQPLKMTYWLITLSVFIYPLVWKSHNPQYIFVISCLSHCA